MRRRKVKVPMIEGAERSESLELIVDGDKVFLVCCFSSVSAEFSGCFAIYLALVMGCVLNSTAASR